MKRFLPCNLCSVLNFQRILTMLFVIIKIAWVKGCVCVFFCGNKKKNKLTKTKIKKFKFLYYKIYRNKSNSIYVQLKYTKNTFVKIKSPLS